MRSLAVSVVLLSVALAGCSSSGGSDVSSGQDVADLVGCTGFDNNSEEIFVSEGGPCDLDGEQINVYYFADNDARDSYVDMGSDFGGNYLVGDGWVVDGSSAVLDTIQDEHGGDRASG